jgi:hypothetical protein
MRQVAKLHRGDALLGLFVALTLLLSACGQSASSAPRRILFIGDSTTFFNQGLDVHLAAMAASDNPPVKLETDNSTLGGASLAVLWDYNNTVEKIRNGHWDIVVLQEDLQGARDAWPQEREQFFTAARKFDQEIRQAKAKTALFMPWVYKMNVAIPLDDGAKAYWEIGKELNAQVIPVGLAWQQAASQQPALDLYIEDGVHPNIMGTFLTTCMHYIAFFGPSVHCAQYQPESVLPSSDKITSKAMARDIDRMRQTYMIPAEQRVLLEKIARETLAAQAESTRR